MITATKIFGIELDDDQINKFKEFYDLVIAQNKKMNLTTITAPREFVIKHVIDSLSAWDENFFHSNLKIIDVGTGAGFPGIPIKILRPSLKIYLLDSLLKRVNFLEKVVKRLALENIEVIHGRAEELSRKKEFREQFDIVVSRAVAKMNVLSEYCLPFAKVNGVFIALKGKNFCEELNESRNAIETMGGGKELIKKKILPIIGEERAIIFIPKKSITPTKFPRREKIIRESQKIESK